MSDAAISIKQVSVVSGKDMKNDLYKAVGLHLANSVWVALFALILLQGCASGQAKKVEVNVASPGMVLTDEAREAFDAAMVLIKAEEYEKSIELLNKVAKAVPGNAISSINLALVYQKLGKLKLAEESLKQALSAEPENPVAHNEYALLYRKTGRFQEARGLYEKTLEQYPNFMMVHKNLGILCDLYMKDYICALKHYVIYSDAMQEDKTVKIWIADIQQRMKR